MAVAGVLLFTCGEEGKLYRINDEDLAIAYFDAPAGIIYAKDNNHADVQEQPQASIDYVKGLELQSADWDHSNWLAIELFYKYDPQLPRYLPKDVLRDIRGKLVDATNLQLMAATNPSIARDEDFSYITLEFAPNNFIPANYYGTQEGTDGNTYFFIAPAANEYNNIHREVWDADNGTFNTAVDLQHGINTMGLQGSFPATFASGFDATTLIDGEAYTLEGIAKVMRNEAPSGVAPRLTGDEYYSVYVINATQTDIVIPTIPGDVNGDGTVDVDDVNAVISVILGKSSPEDYVGDVNVDGQGNVDVDDVQCVISIILGK